MIRSGDKRAAGFAILASIFGLGVIFVFLLLASRQIVPGNSDGATVVLEGQSIAQGHVGLAGWTLSLDSFWTIDALLYALGIGLAGIGGWLLTVVPAVIAVLVVGVAALMARDEMSSRARVVAVATTVGLLCFPLHGFAMFFVQGPLHVGTTLWCLLAFFALRRPPLGASRLALGVIFLAAGVLGDFQTVLLGVLPVFGAGLATMIRKRSWRSGLLLALVAPASMCVALIVREVMKHVGTFSLAKANPIASGHQIAHNVLHLPGYAAAIMGVTQAFGPSGVPLVLRLVHIVGLLVVILAVLVGLRSLWLGLSKPGDEKDGSSVLDDLLVLAFVGDMAVFVFLPIVTSFNYARYLTAGVVFGAILAGRAAGHMTSTWSSHRYRQALVGLGLLVALYGCSFGIGLTSPSATQPATQLAAFLKQKGLVQGIGDYWSASITTVEGGGSVAVRPVIALPDGRIVRYEKQSDASWYEGVPFRFFVFNTALLWEGDTAAGAKLTFGPPARTYVVGTYRVLVWNHPISVSPEGWQGP